MSSDVILMAAERMFAERGAGVALRDIAAAAGQRNNSAVHYHFGDRDGLVRAIVNRRLEAVEATCARLLPQLDRGDDHAMLAALVSSLLDGSTQMGGRHYFRFLEVMRDQVKGWPVPAGGSAWNSITESLSELVDGVTPADRASRISSMTTAMFALLADYERALDDPNHSPGTAPEHIVLMLVGLLRAPLTPAPNLSSYFTVSTQRLPSST
ncbi:helix-turn-helix domain containing protein [Mycobacteroides abscessus subsp. abscessus]|uniref:TetR/AcrR family transcriptional regulator n=1 Tax=Mycobacteroides abscessus TaxID=36809 RepID=UPI00266C08D3|nr:TetR/AcrR family transcriptional regulator [Mycobacteroides abscessus]MDO3014677.1 helix-turn-helix domain containing protein [Mycobacteroides abscessus subsp. abscessus]